MKQIGTSDKMLHVLVLSLLFSAVTPTTLAAKKAYIVYLGAHSHPEATEDIQRTVINSHHQLLGSVLGGVEKARESIFYSYANSINGFAAMLNEEEATELTKHPGVVSVFPNKKNHLLTTHSWEFLGLEHEGKTLPKSLWEKGNYGEDVIIGHIDSGVWPESMSFSDEGLGPVPSRWKGVCQNETDGHGFKCNRKLIGARYFTAGYLKGAGKEPLWYRSPRDRIGHGTLTLSTAAGSFVQNANIFGLANGTAKGGSPRARVATYKACGSCSDVDILAAYDAAIGDGVDVITISLGNMDAGDYFSDSFSIGSFHAVSRGIAVVAAGGNDINRIGTVTNVAPWLFTVGASTMDREFVSHVSLGNNKTFQGPNLSSSSMAKGLYPLAKASDVKAANATNHTDIDYCRPGTLDPKKVKGKIIACVTNFFDSTVSTGHVVKEAGGIGMILCKDKNSENFTTEPQLHVLPATVLSANDSKEVFAYINSSKSPVAYVGRPITKFHTATAPVMAFFSAGGPNPTNPEILKPDITAPGFEILASKPPFLPASDYVEFDRRHVNFTVVHGTSLSCPHVAGIVGLLKNAHPDWSPAAIKSAIMTTATHQNKMKKQTIYGPYSAATPFDYGSGHLHPNGAMDPGLVYDISVTDYFNFLCAIGYNKTSVFMVAGKSYSCPEQVPEVTDLNYPSITIPSLNGTKTVSRTVKNVGEPGTYTALTDAPPGTVVSVRPRSLKFDRIGEEKNFTVTVKAKKGSAHKGYVFGWVNWSDGVHHVRSPITVGIGSN
ncbi:subtilisin-like protease SBT5.3 [Nymphaea colorata]|nr:subtilisin-like protease SBT5.3 [Nymphaea colorata]